ncbi:chaperonin [Cedecea davisae]|uniref:chaperonin n=1 Tax=Cedecea davisae TaxID=158484 RepID=UPI001C0EFD53|nr:chaperonin [Cedecea davisae]MBU4685532.1 chaperonin [Cedecea davisae]
MTNKRDKASLYKAVADDKIGDAMLKVNTPAPADEPDKREVRTKTLKAIPASYFDLHKELRKSNKTALDFSSYIMEALREKFERDGALNP